MPFIVPLRLSYRAVLFWSPLAFMLYCAVGHARTNTPKGEPKHNDASTVDTLEALRQFEREVFGETRVPGVVRDDQQRISDVARRLSIFPPPPWLRPYIAGPNERQSSIPAPKDSVQIGLKMPDIPIRWDDKVVRYLEYYRTNPTGRAIMRQWLRRMGRYQDLISKKLRAHGLPQALIYVAMIESGFDPLRTSRVGAAGLWQFMRKTGEHYGLKRDHWFDERRNPERSTDAALRCLNRLHKRLNSWELALAAYNAGFGAVVQALQKYNTNDFWRLSSYEAGLPWATVLYVPKIMAAAIVGTNRQFFGFDDVKPEPPLSSELVVVRVSASLGQLARAAGVTSAQMQALNPELRRKRTPPNAETWIRVPIGTRQSFYKTLARLKGGDAAYSHYVVRLGDTIDGIAQRLGISATQLRRVNRLRSDYSLRPEITLLVPLNTRNKRRNPATKPTGDDRILVPLASECPSHIPGRTRVFYRVVLGDTLPMIARYLKTTPEELARWNGISKTARIVSKMILQAFVPKGFDRSRVVLLDPDTLHIVSPNSEAYLALFEQRRGRQRRRYTVKRGDTLISIGRRFRISTGNIMRINGLSRKTKLTAGQELVLYLDSSRNKRRARR